MNISKAVTIRHLLQCVWLGVVLLNVYWLLNCDGAFVPHECRMLHWIVIGLLCFPLSALWFLIVLAFGWILEVAGVISGQSPAPPMLEWVNLLIIVGLGFYQWFWGLPWIVTKVKGALARRNNAGGA